MLIDDLRELNIHLGPDKIRDAVVFRINERLEEFAAAHLRPTIKEPLPSLLPYRNMIIHFNDSLEWYLSTDISNSLTLANCFFRTDTLRDLRFGDQPHLAVFVNIESITRNFTGGNIFYPNQKQLEYDNSGRRSENTLLSEKSENEVMNHIMHSYAYLHAFLNILSCKNIMTELETPNKKIQQKRATKGKLPLVSFYTLKIINVGHGKGSTDSKKDLWSNRIHFCRGHMREYSVNAPLFGHLFGRFWIPPHVRGDKNKGIIIKDYEVDSKSG